MEESDALDVITSMSQYDCRSNLLHFLVKQLFINPRNRCTGCIQLSSTVLRSTAGQSWQTDYLRIQYLCVSHLLVVIAAGDIVTWCVNGAPGFHSTTCLHAFYVKVPPSSLRYAPVGASSDKPSISSNPMC